VPSFTDLHVECLLTVLDRSIFGGRLAPGWVGGGWPLGQCYIISREECEKCYTTLHGERCVEKPAIFAI